MRSSLDESSIRHEYEEHGVESFYRESGARYRNPHEPQIQRSIEIGVELWRPDLSHVLDLAAGSGEVTLGLKQHGAHRIDGIDPYTHEAYQARVGQSAEQVTFEQIAAGALEGREYTLIVCSFALHLCEASRLPALAYQLSRIGPALWVLTPHKRPAICSEWGWDLAGENVVQRVRSRFYRSRP